jgi:hypothetical protein
MSRLLAFIIQKILTLSVVREPCHIISGEWIHKFFLQVRVDELYGELNECFLFINLVTFLLNLLSQMRFRIVCRPFGFSLLGFDLLLVGLTLPSYFESNLEGCSHEDSIRGNSFRIFWVIHVKYGLVP